MRVPRTIAVVAAAIGIGLLAGGAQAAFVQNASGHFKFGAEDYDSVRGESATIPNGLADDAWAPSSRRCPRTCGTASRRSRWTCGTRTSAA